jgi:hypothetical protein
MHAVMAMFPKYLLAGFGLAGFGVLSLALSAQAQVFDNATLSPKFSPNPTELKGVSGGGTSAASLAGKAETPTGSCVGYVDSQPDHTITLKAFFESLTMETASSVDTTMVVKGPGGVWCNDDLHDKNAGVSGQWFPGTYEVWVGTFNQSKSVPYVLKITEGR